MDKVLGAKLKIYLITKNGVRARAYGIEDQFNTIEAAQEVADRLNYRTFNNKWSVEEMQRAN